MRFYERRRRECEKKKMLTFQDGTHAAIRITANDFKKKNVALQIFDSDFLLNHLFEF